MELQNDYSLFFHLQKQHIRFAYQNPNSTDFPFKLMLKFQKWHQKSTRFTQIPFGRTDFAAKEGTKM